MQGLERVLRAAFRNRAEHDHRQTRMRLADLFQRLKPVHLRHLDIERDEIRRELRNLLQRNASIRGLAHHFDRGIGGDDVTHHPANQHRIVNDEHLRFFHMVSSVRNSRDARLTVTSAPRRGCNVCAAPRLARSRARSLE